MLSCRTLVTGNRGWCRNHAQKEDRRTPRCWPSREPHHSRPHGANLHRVQFLRGPFSKGATAGNSRSGLNPLLFSGRPNLLPCPFTWDAPRTATGADSARSPRLSQARRAGTTSTNRRSLGSILFTNNNIHVHTFMYDLIIKKRNG